MKPYSNHVSNTLTIEESELFRLVGHSLKCQGACPKNNNPDFDKRNLVGGFSPLEKYYIVKMGIHYLGIHYLRPLREVTVTPTKNSPQSSTTLVFYPPKKLSKTPSHPSHLFKRPPIYIYSWWLNQPTPLKNMNQIGSCPQVNRGEHEKNIWVATTFHHHGFHP